MRDFIHRLLLNGSSSKDPYQPAVWEFHPPQRADPCDILTWVRLTVGYSPPWRCGPCADVLYRTLQLCGYDAQLVIGIANNVEHVWVELDGVVLDPTDAQFDPPVHYAPKTRFRPSLWDAP